MARDPNAAWKLMMQKKRDEAVQAATPLMLAGDYDGAEKLVRAADDDILGMVAIFKMYRARLQELVASGEAQTNRQLAHDIFFRARTMAWRAYPEIHTAEEAERYAAHQVDDEAQLVQILGYLPPKP